MNLKLLFYFTTFLYFFHRLYIFLYDSSLSLIQEIRRWIEAGQFIDLSSREIHITMIQRAATLSRLQGIFWSMLD